MFQELHLFQLRKRRGNPIVEKSERTSFIKPNYPTQIDDSSGGITIEKDEHEDKDEEESHQSSHVIESVNLPFTMDESLNYAAGDVCKKLLKNVNCRVCRVQIEVEGSRENGDEGQHDIDLAYPSESFLKYFKALTIHGEQELPTVCMESNLKKCFGRGKSSSAL